MKEIWKDIPGYEGRYQVSDKGRIKTYPSKRWRVSRIMKPQLGVSGYYRVLLTDKFTRRHYTIHRVVLETFVAPCPKFFCAAHLDGKRNNNTLKNLRWVSYKENMAHKKMHGTHHMGERNTKARLSKKQVIKIRLSLQRGTVLADKYGVSTSTISSIRTNRTWKHI